MYPSPLPRPTHNVKRAFFPNLSNMEFTLGQREVLVVIAPLMKALVDVFLDRHGGSRRRGVTLMLE